MRASSEDNFYKAGWWNGIDDPEAGLKGHALAIDYQACLLYTSPSPRDA